MGVQFPPLDLKYYHRFIYITSSYYRNHMASVWSFCRCFMYSHLRSPVLCEADPPIGVRWDLKDCRGHIHYEGMYLCPSMLDPSASGGPFEFLLRKRHCRAFLQIGLVNNLCVYLQFVILRHLCLQKVIYKLVVCLLVQVSRFLSSFYPSSLILLESLNEILFRKFPHYRERTVTLLLFHEWSNC